MILSDGDLSTLANMKVNLGLNHFSVETDMSETTEDPNMVTDNILLLVGKEMNDSALELHDLQYHL